MSDSAEGESVPEYLRTLANQIEDGELRVSHAVAKASIRETKRAHSIKIDRSIVGESVAIEVSEPEAVIGEVVKEIEKSESSIDDYEEFYAEGGETYKVVKVDE